MAMKLRLARHGRKDRPYYWIMAADARSPRNTGKEKLGTYDPLRAKEDPQRLQMDVERIQHWLSRGAEPTDRVRRFLGHAGLLPKMEFPDTPKKSKETAAPDAS